MLLELSKKKITLVDNTVENLNSAKIYLVFKDLTIKQSDVVKMYFNEKEQFKIENDVFKINPTSFLGNRITVKVVVYHENLTATVYETSMDIEQYFSLGKQPYEKMPQVLIDINKEIKRLEDKILDLEKHKNLF